MDEGREGLTGIDRAIARALDVDPSAEFPARVRQRVAREPMRGPLWRGWRVWIPIGAAAAIVVVVALRPPAKPATSGGAIMAPTPSVAGLETPDVKGRSGTPDLKAGRTKLAVAPELKVGRTGAAGGGTSRARRAYRPEVLVPREEIEMYRRLIGRAVPGAVVLDPPADAAATRTFADITIDPIRIDLIAPPENGEGVRQ